MNLMITHMTSAFYPGAGLDIVPPVLFPEIKTWWYMDSKSSPSFIHHVEHALHQCGFLRERIDGHRRDYYSASTRQSIYYQFGTSFPNDWDSLIHALMKHNVLVLCGFDIHAHGPLPPRFFTYYEHIITSNQTDRSIWKPHVYDFHQISEIRLYDQWNPVNATKDDILENCSVEKNIK